MISSLAKLRLLAAAGLAAVAIAGCGGDDEEGGNGAPSETAVQQVEEAAHPERFDFPEADGKTLQQIADMARTGFKYAPATSHYVVGNNRMAFGLLDENNKLIYAPTAVYIANSPQDKAQGPFYAPTDSLVTKPAYRSKTAALEGDPVAGIYSTEIPLPRPGRYAVLVLTNIGGQWRGAATQVTAQENDPIPAVGERPPAVKTETLEDVGANVELIDTRQPPSDMHNVSFDEVLGKKPVALLFATPALCQSRVCGPVVDIAEQLRNEGYGDDIEFIHQEVWVDNDLNKGLREPLRKFNLQTEPWLFTVDADGRVAARLEGSFGLREFEEALKAAGGDPDN
ncbi:MAG TPA: hypothetical protein VIL04_03005 [Solirubrobacterales bacterium]|jgi:hypothetical protein